jgi:hypothetical protein
MLHKPDLVPVIEKYMSLRRSGDALMGLCPFHEERHPSFYVYPHTQRFHCYGCNESGDIIDFVRLIEHTDFAGALTVLGIENPRIKTQNLKQKRDELARDVKTLYLKVLFAETLRLHERVCINWLRTYNHTIASRYDFFWDDPDLIAKHLPELLERCTAQDEINHVIWWVHHAMKCRDEIETIRYGSDESKLTIYKNIVGG